MIMPCMNSTSACDRAGSVPLVDGGSVLLGLPGAPGCTTTGPAAEPAAALAASSTPHRAAHALAERIRALDATRIPSSFDFNASVRIFNSLIPSGRDCLFGRTIIIQSGEF